MQFFGLITGTWTFPHFIFCKFVIILPKNTINSSKTGKMRDIPGLSSEFSDLTPFGKLPPPTGSKKLPRTEIVQDYTKLFRKQQVSFHKSKNFGKTENFSGQESPALTIVFDPAPCSNPANPPWNSSPVREWMSQRKDFTCSFMCPKRWSKFK